MQTASEAFKARAKASVREIGWAVMMSFKKEYVNDIDFFTIGVSPIGGNDFIKPSGSDVIQEWDKYEYQEFTDRIISVEWQREVDPVSSVSMAIADIVFDNHDDFFTPGSGSEIDGYILPYRPIRIFAGFDPEAIPVFVGLTEKMPVINKKAKTATFHCIDYLSSLLNRPLDRTTMMIDVRTDEALARIFESAGLLPMQYEFDAGFNIIPFFYYEKGAKLLGIAQKLMEAEMGRLYMDETGIIRFKNRQNYNDTSAYRFGPTYREFLLKKEKCETGNLPLSFSSVGAIWGPGTATIDTTSKVNGIKSIKFANTGEASVAAVKNLGAAHGTLYLQLSGFIPTDFSFQGQFCALFSLRNAANDTVIIAGNIEDFGNDNPRLTLSGADLAWTDTQIDLPKGKVFKLEIGMVLDSALGRVAVWLNNHDEANPDFDSGPVDTGETPVQWIYFGKSYVSGAIGEYYLDDFVANDQFIGRFSGGEIADDNILDAVKRREDDIINVVVIRSAVRKVQAKQKYWELAEAERIKPGETISVWADFNDPCTSVDSPVYITSATTSLFTVHDGEDPVQSNPVAGEVTLSSATLFGGSYLMTFTNNSNRILFITTIELFTTPAMVIKTIYIREQNDASVAKYDEKPLEINNDFFWSDDDARSKALILLDDYASYGSVDEIEVKGTPALQLDDAITALLDDEDEDDYFITKINSKIMTGKYTQILKLKKFTRRTYFTINLSLVNGDDCIAP